MKAGSKFLNAASAVALSAGIVASGAGVVSMLSVTAAEASTVSRIVVQGNSRIDASTVRGNLTIKPGKSFDNNDIDESVKRLFATGLFSDVKISVSGGALVVNVKENQIVNAVVFNGNKKLKDKQLEGTVQTKSLGPYNTATLESDVQSIKDAYAAIGREDATVTTQVVNLDGGRVNVAFNINEGDRTKITKINFVGNQAFGDGRLADVIKTKRSGILSFLTRKDVYDQDKLRADEELLRRFYYNHGYADFRVISSVADLDPTQNEYTITITVDEGERYTFGNVQVESSVEGVDAKQLQGLVESRSGSTYSAEDVEDTITAISDRIASEGYPFAQVTPRGDRDFAARKIGVTYLVDQGARAYVERIEIRGNTRTRDYVIRREFDISEGDAFNQTMIRKAKKRLEDLGFFSSVNVSTAPGSEPDRVVIVVDVQDQPTGEFSIGGGYSTGVGATVEAGITERNFLGRGQFIRVAAGGGADVRTYNLSFTEPYFLGYRLAAGFDLSREENSAFDQYSYTQDNFTLRFAAPITDTLSAGLAYSYTKTSYSDFDNRELSNVYFNALNETDDRVKSSVIFSLTYDTLDDHKLPREGFYVRGAVEYAGLGGDADFAKLTGKATYYHPLIESADVIGSATVGAGHLFETNGSVNVFDQFFLGGETIRGFDSRGIGPRAIGTNSTGDYNDPLGGTTYFNASVEASFPMPIVPQDIGIRGAVFADAATLYGSSISNSAFQRAGEPGDTVFGDSMQWRASVGASIIWASPFGPLRFDYAFPVVKEDFDDVQHFRFGASTRF